MPEEKKIYGMAARRTRPFLPSVQEDYQIFGTCPVHYPALKYNLSLIHI